MPASGGGVPRLQRYYQGATTSCRPSRRTSLPSLGDTTGTLAFRSRRRRVSRPTGLGLVTRYPRPGILPWRRPCLPRSWGTRCTFALLFDPGRIDVSGHLRHANAAPALTTTKAPTFIDFRGSITRLRHWLRAPCEAWSASQPRVTPPPRKTRFRVPARLYRTGFPPAGFLQKVSNSRHVCYPPLPSFHGARSELE